MKDESMNNFVKGFFDAALRDGETLENDVESPYPWSAPWLWGGDEWKPRKGESYFKAGARWYRGNAAEIKQLVREQEEAE